MGRPPIGKRAMTAAERMRRHRAKLPQQARQKTVTITKRKAAKIVALMEGLARRLAELESESDKYDEAIARLARLKGGGIQFACTLYDLLSLSLRRCNLALGSNATRSTTTTGQASQLERRP